ncbi:MAG: IclR family transcriptional regulator [Clostridia bacterium]|nr:IclR family transcriptional regulator [Clostridia bacterium]
MSEDRNLVQAVLKALDIMEALCRNPHSGVRELSEKVGLNRSTVNRLVATLEQAGYVEQDRERGKYRASLRLFELGNKVVQDLDIKERAYPIMQKLSKATEETIYLAVLDGNQFLYVSIIDSPQMLRCSANIGISPPMYCSASGKVILTYLSEDRKLAFLPEKFHLYGPNTISNFTDLEAELAGIRRNGYAIDDEEWNPDTRALAAPVWNYDRKIQATLSIAGPKVRMPRQRMEEIAQLLVKGAQELSASLGYRETGLRGFANHLKTKI